MQEALQAAQDLASQLNIPKSRTNISFRSSDQSDGIARPLSRRLGQMLISSGTASRGVGASPEIHGSAADLRIANELRTVLTAPRGDV